MNQPIPSRREFLGTTAAGLASTALASASAAAQEGWTRPKTRPNLLFVFADQLGRNRCGYAGDEKARTPVLDRFAAEGMDFSQAVSTMPVCSAFRASLLTGKYPTTTGMVINEIRMNPNHECFGHVLTRAGYETGYVGKWHLYANELGNHLDPKNSFVPPGPDRLGFDGYWAGYNFHHNYYDAYYHTESPEKISYGDGVYEPDGQTDLAIDFLDGAAKTDRPFALFLSYGTPHDPWEASNVPDKYKEMFDDVPFPNPPNYAAKNDRYADGWGRLGRAQREQLEDWRRHYYAMVANLDWNIGRLLKALEGAGLRDNTLIVFTSDHGEMFGAHGRRAKNIFYEEAARIPFLAQWPGMIPAGSVNDACLGTVDIMPSILGLMGLPVPEGVEGMNLGSLALGSGAFVPSAAFLQNTGAVAAWQDGHEWRALRDTQYTYAVYRVDGHELLFDNLGDPYQMTNLAESKEHGKTLKRFRRMLKDKMASLEDTFETCSWYRDHWTEDRLILRGARG